MNDTPTLAVAVMAHPKRRARAELLADHTDADLVVWDVDKAGEWLTGATTWKMAATLGASHTLVLQDDAEPVDDLRRHVLAALSLERSSALSLYLGRSKPSRWALNVADAVNMAEVHGASWIVASHLLHGVAVVLPTPWITPMLQWCEMSGKPYDQRIGAYLRQVRSKPTLYTWPSLVDHADDIPSLVRHADDARATNDGRVAYRVGLPAKLTHIAVTVATPEGAEV